MDKHEFLRIIDECCEVIRKYLSEDENRTRFDYMLESLDQMKAGVMKGTIPTNILSLPVTAMMERDDPEDMIKSIQAVWYYYRDHYQKLID